MAGNRKPNRKKGGGAPKTSEQFFAQLDKQTLARQQRYREKNKRTSLKNELPIGHPLNRHKIDKTFKPLEQVLVEQEQGKGMLADEDGQVLIYSEQEQEFIPFVPGMLHMCYLYDKFAEAQVWGKQPPGLRAFTLKLGRDEKVNQQDIDDARATIAWMRERVATVTPARWTELFVWACELDRKEQEKHGNL